MGLFDVLECKHPMPDGTVPTGWFQTKSFQCDGMREHLIDEEGCLWLDFGSAETVPEAERPYPNNNGWLGMMGSIKWNRKLKKQENFTGSCRFDDEHHEYVAVWIDGKLAAIRVVTG